MVGDDFHLKIRSERPEAYPDRYRIPIDMAPWSRPCTGYHPPYYVSPGVIAYNRLINTEGKADPEDQWTFPDIVDWGREYTRAKDGKPLNPSGRTGIQGRGSLWLWGSNPMLFLCPVLYNPEMGHLECLINTQEKESDIISIHFRRDESFEEAMKRAQEKTNLDVTSCYVKTTF